MLRCSSALWTQEEQLPRPGCRPGTDSSASTDSTLGQYVPHPALDPLSHNYCMYMYVCMYVEGGCIECTASASDVYLSLHLRSATHSHVVRLLRGSGTSPTLLVSSPHSARDWGERPGSANRRLGGASRKGGVVSPLAAEIRQQSSVFRQKMEEVLLPQEKERVMLELSRFSRQK